MFWQTETWNNMHSYKNTCFAIINIQPFWNSWPGRWMSASFFCGAYSTSNCLALESHRYTMQATQIGCEYSRERVIAYDSPFHVHSSHSRMVCSLRRQRVFRSRMGEEWSASEKSACLENTLALRGVKKKCPCRDPGHTFFPWTLEENRLIFLKNLFSVSSEVALAVKRRFF